MLNRQSWSMPTESLRFFKFFELKDMLEFDERYSVN